MKVCPGFSLQEGMPGILSGMQQAGHDVPSTPAGVKARASREVGGPVT